ncbi:MAG: hypothetical protein FJ030_11500 [Chloroflexi bacterium]|nr:hypothetical protein [Chloroflexota bacterium]
MTPASSPAPPLPLERQSLEAIFAPKTVAVIGATEEPGSVGRALLHNLIGSSFGGMVFPVNPKRPSVLGVKAYPRIADAPDPVDLAVIATPAPTVPAIVGECAQAGVKGGLITSTGFRERGAAGAELEKQVKAQAGAMRIVGPGSLGIMRPPIGLNATFARPSPRPGSIALVSQSATLGASILDWGQREQVGFSAFISTGGMLDADWSDFIELLDEDAHTQSILIYMESIPNPRAFISAARKAAYNKPIIALKAGRLAGSDAALDAAFRRCGVLRVDQLADLFSMAEVLTKQPRPKGSRLTIVTNAGGPGVVAADALLAGGGELADLSSDTITALNESLAGQWSQGNPVDIRNDATPERYAKAAEILSKDNNSDGLLVILTPLDVTEPTRAAELIAPFARVPGKPILAAWMGGDEVAAGIALLNGAGVPTFVYPDIAARAFNNMRRHSDTIRGIYETPAALDDEATSAQSASAIIQSAHEAGRTALDPAETAQLLAAYNIPMAAGDSGISQSGGFELAVASAIDEVFGPAILFGAGGRHVEAIGGTALGIPPLNTTLARRLMEQTRLYGPRRRSTSLARDPPLPHAIRDAERAARRNADHHSPHPPRRRTVMDFYFAPTRSRNALIATLSPDSSSM